METLQSVLLVLQVVMAGSLIALILVQHGKGADAGAAFGSGASSTVFGSRGSGNFLTKTTAALAFVFLVNSLALAYLANQRVRTSTSIMDGPIPITQPIQDRALLINEVPTEPGAGIPE